MATLNNNFGSIVPPENTLLKDDGVSGKLSSSKAMSWVTMTARNPRPMDVTPSSPSEGVLHCQHLHQNLDLSVYSDLDHGLQRGSSQALPPLERTAGSSASGRREFLGSSLCLSFVSGFSWTPTEAAAAADVADDTTTGVPLELYRDAKDGFTLMRPAPWNQVDKPGAAIFFEDPESRSNNIGVTVAPVRIASLNAFGTVDEVVKKLVKAERDKPSTKDIQVVGALERRLRDNTPLYALEYTLDTTRGNKRVLTSVTVADYKLYILNIIFADGPVAPASQGLTDALHQVLNSFELLA